jgi:hypothetical protein
MRQLFLHRLQFREEAEAALQEFVSSVHDLQLAAKDRFSELAVTGDGLREQGRPARRGRCLLTAPLERPNVETAR